MRINQANTKDTKSELIIAVLFAFLPSTALAEKIDWQGSTTLGIDNTRSVTAPRRASGLPGVNLAPARQTRNNNCPDGSPRSQAFDGISGNDGCSAKAPLIIFRDGNVDGLLSRFPR